MTLKGLVIGFAGGDDGYPHGNPITSKDITAKVCFYDDHKFIKIAFFFERRTSFTFTKIWYVELPNGRRCFLNLSSDAFNGKPDTAYIEQAPADDAFGEHVQVTTGGYYGIGPFGNAENSVLQLRWVRNNDD